MRARLFCVFVMSLAAVTITACGFSTPEIGEFADKEYPGDAASETPPVSATAQIEFEIKKRVYCELRDAVAAASRYPVSESETLSSPRRIQYRSLIPPGWIAQIALSLQVDRVGRAKPRPFRDRTHAERHTKVWRSNDLESAVFQPWSWWNSLLRRNTDRQI